MSRTTPTTDLREALRAARALITGARVVLDQRAVALSVLDELDRATGRLGSAAAPGSETASPVEVEREGRVAAEASQRRTEFLEEAISTLFSSPLDLDKRLETLTALLVPDLADWCFCDYFVEGGARRLGVRTWNPDREALARSLEGLQDLASPLMAATMWVAREKRSVVDFERADGESNAPFVPLLDLLGAKSFLAVPLLAAGNVVGVLTLVFAESNRRYAEGDLRLVEDLAVRAALAMENARLVVELERAVRSRDDMMAILSHDLRNPLSSIQMSATLMQGVLGEDEKRDRRSKTNIILRSATRMETLIRDLLDVASLESGGVTVTLESCSALALLAEAAELIQPLADDKAIVVDVRYPGADVRVAADSDRILQVFSNLLGNAVKFTPREGRVTLSAAAEGSGCRFTVRDNGPGIPPDDLAHVFDRYWRARARKSTDGAGLGLAIAKGIVLAHGETLAVDSVVGEGTSFTFTLPYLAAGGEVPGAGVVPASGPS